MARSYSQGSRGANKVRASVKKESPFAEFDQNDGTPPPEAPTTRQVLAMAGKNPDIEPFIEGPLGLSPKEVKDFSGAEVFDSASDTTFTSQGGAKYKVEFDLRFAMTDVEDGEEGEKEPTLVKYSISSITNLANGTRMENEYGRGEAALGAIVGSPFNEAAIRDAVDAEFQKSMVEAGNYNLAKRVGKLAG